MTLPNASTTVASNCVPAQRRSSVDRLRDAHRRAVGPGRHHRVERVDDRDDARADRDRIGGETVGVAVAVRSLVARAHDRRDPGKRRRRGDDPLADQGVPLHEVPLVLVERAGLAEDRLGHRRLADVVQLGRDARAGDLLG